ncbi:uracil-DNA glycosylase family protein [Zobellella maritima]|uniref:uracil-DNA glycosylase family protein n=1 Tax=Zobellella maritima TaxID=2059725 RepID=UPI000E302627|nr:uracil-DNA glycosylase family protein [Zobellella maritima]
MAEPLDKLLVRVRNCQICAASLPLGPRPVVQIARQARIMIIGQAPGLRVHKTGLPWNDASGDNLRNWLGVSREQFYNPSLFAIMPMGFCYPGKSTSGDLPPRPECAPAWHHQLWELLPNIELTLLIGRYAQRYYLIGEAYATLTETVRHWQQYAPTRIPLPHPSPRNRRWLSQNPWFEQEELPALRARVHEVLGDTQR